MVRTAEGYVPKQGFLQQQMELIREIKSGELPEYEICEYDPLLDSSNMTPDNWVAIARDIRAKYDDYDGFVVLHGPG
jgi:L-asparaginase